MHIKAPIALTLTLSPVSLFLSFSFAVFPCLSLSLALSLSFTHALFFAGSLSLLFCGLKWNGIKDDLRSIKVCTKTRNFHRYHGVFTGAQAVSHLLRFMHAQSEERYQRSDRIHALRIGQRLIEENILQPLKPGDLLHDNDRCLYQIVSFKRRAEDDLADSPPRKRSTASMDDRIELSDEPSEKRGLSRSLSCSSSPQQSTLRQGPIHARSLRKKTVQEKKEQKGSSVKGGTSPPRLAPKARLFPVQLVQGLNLDLGSAMGEIAPMLEVVGDSWAQPRTAAWDPLGGTPSKTAATVLASREHALRQLLVLLHKFMLEFIVEATTNEADRDTQADKAPKFSKGLFESQNYSFSLRWVNFN